MKNFTLFLLSAAALGVSPLASSTAFAAGAASVRTCTGTEPFWGLTFTASEVKFQTADGLKYTIARPAARTASGRSSDYIALFQGKVKEQPGRYLNVIVRDQDCSSPLQAAG